MQVHGISIDEAALADICRRYWVKELSAFGSVLRADFRADSDVDLLVEFEPGASIGFLALAGLQEELAVLLGRKVDLVPKPGLKRAIRGDVLAQAWLLYRSRSGSAICGAGPAL